MVSLKKSLFLLAGLSWGHGTLAGGQPCQMQYCYNSQTKTVSCVMNKMVTSTVDVKTYLSAMNAALAGTSTLMQTVEGPELKVEVLNGEVKITSTDGSYMTINQDQLQKVVRNISQGDQHNTSGCIETSCIMYQ